MNSWCMDLALDHEVDGTFVEQTRGIEGPPWLFVLVSERMRSCGWLAVARE